MKKLNGNAGIDRPDPFGMEKEIHQLNKSGAAFRTIIEPFKIKSV